MKSCTNNLRIFSILLCVLIFLSSCLSSEKSSQNLSRELGRSSTIDNVLDFKTSVVEEAGQTYVNVIVHRTDSQKLISVDEITAQVEAPNGSQQRLTLALKKQDSKGQNFVGVMPDIAKDQNYKVTVTIHLGKGYTQSMGVLFRGGRFISF
jgi:PDZ domain-containing secreted protein